MPEENHTIFTGAHFNWFFADDTQQNILMFPNQSPSISALSFFTLYMSNIKSPFCVYGNRLLLILTYPNPVDGI